MAASERLSDSSPFLSRSLTRMPSRKGKGGGQERAVSRERLGCLPARGGPARLPWPPCCPDVTPNETIDTLADLVQEERERLTRLWAKRLREELYELDLPGRDLRAPLRRLLRRACPPAGRAAR